jgi:glycosyltransferase involved in cell wall biosynthesis
LQGRPIRILVLIEATRITGIARNVLDFIAAQSECSERAAATLGIVVVARRPARDAPLARAAQEAGVRVFMLSERRRFDPRAIRHLRQICEEFQPDLIESHAVKSHVLVWLAGVRHRHRWIAFHHGYTFTDVKTRAYNAFDRVTLRRAHRVVTVAGAFRVDLLKRGVDATRVDVLHNGAPSFPSFTPHEISALRQKLELADGARVILAVGRLSFEKGFLDLLRAFAAIHDGIGHSHLLIAGDGPERARLEREIERLNVNGRVTLLGMVSDAAPLYQLADLVVLPSATEGCPNVLLEAMVAGVPVVATRVGGVPEIVEDDRTALLARPHAIEELARAMRRLLLNRPLARRLASEARRHVAEHYTTTRRAERLLAIYWSCLMDGARERAAPCPADNQTSNASAGV